MLLRTLSGWFVTGLALMAGLPLLRARRWLSIAPYRPQLGATALRNSETS